MPDAADGTIDLLQRWHKGDHKALHQLLEFHLPRLHEFVCSQLRNELKQLRREHDSSDYVQDVALKTLRYMPPFVPSDGEQFQRLLRTFVRNAIRNQLRSPRAAGLTGRAEYSGHSVLDLRASSRSSMMPERAVERAERKDKVRSLARVALEFVDEEDRRIVEMHLFDVLSWEEIARELGIRSDAVRMRYHRALAKMANHIRRLKEGCIEELLESSGC